MRLLTNCLNKVSLLTSLPTSIHTMYSQFVIKLARGRFIHEVVDTCASSGVTLTLTNGTSVKTTEESDNLGSSGYFCDDSMTLAVATGNSNWFEILLHEYMHLEQYLEGKFFSKEDNKLSDHFFEWLDGKRELSKRTLNKAFNSILACEIDCEKRVLKKVRTNKHLGIDPIEYARSANIYLMAYRSVVNHRRWVFDTEPADIEGLYRLVPSTKIISLAAVKSALTNEFDRVVDENCFD